jgi:MscS family membrane protein
MQSFWETITTYTVAGNELWRLLGLFLALLLSLIAGKILRLSFEKSASTLEKKNHALLSVVVGALAKPIVMVSFIVGLRIGVSFLNLIPVVQNGVETMVSILMIGTIGYVAYRLVDVISYWLATAAARTESMMDDMLVPMVRTSLRITVVILTLLQIATMLSDKPLTSILAGLGVGGLALALAAQDTVKNFFGSLVIFADKPFELGERIVVDGHDGAIEQVGFRSTRIRTLDGHLVTIPNGELANKTIQNISKRPHIRRILNLTITYDTPPEKVDRAVEIAKDILKEHEGMHPDFPPRVYFDNFNDTSLNLFVIYWYHPPDWWAYCAFSEQVNRMLLRRFNEEGIDFAFPTQTLHLAGDPKRPLHVGRLSEGQSNAG